MYVCLFFLSIAVRVDVSYVLFCNNAKSWGFLLLSLFNPIAQYYLRSDERERERQVVNNMSCVIIGEIAIIPTNNVTVTMMSRFPISS